MTPAQTQAIEKLRAFNRELEETAPTIVEVHIVTAEIEAVIAMIEDDPENQGCSFPHCACRFPRRCHR